jgi:hypothetical protein
MRDNEANFPPPITDARSAISDARRRANIENSSRSTGPKTEEGKKKSRLNARRSLLHCQIECLPAEDLAVYQKMLDEIVAELNPVGPSEKFHAVAIAQSMWRLNHAMALMQGIFAAGHLEKIDSIDTGHHEVDNSLAAAQTFLEWSRQLNLLTIYESRIRRALAADRAALKALQDERRSKYGRAVQQATDMMLLAQVRGETYEPGDDFEPASEHGGFVFSESELARRFNRAQRVKDAEHFRTHKKDPRPRPDMAA